MALCSSIRSLSPNTRRAFYLPTPNRQRSEQDRTYEQERLDQGPEPETALTPKAKRPGKQVLPGSFTLAAGRCCEAPTSRPAPGSWPPARSDVPPRAAATHTLRVYD